MKNLNKTKIFFLAITAVAISSCSNDDKPVNEEELITTVRITLVSGGQTITLTSRDLDGDGPNPPVITPATGSLSLNTTYNGTVTFLNESVTPADDITVEVEEEGVDHQIFYQAPSTIGTFTYLDADANGKPIGLDFTLTTGSSSTTGNLTVTLRHLPNKSAAGVASGDITNAGGSTDAAVTYPISIGN